jgi:23S rRNA (adenine1618-N6)-methyltransferase
MSKQLTEKKTTLQEINTALGMILSSLKNSPELKPFVFINEHAIETIDFSDPNAVKALNKSLLTSYYGIKNWDIQILSLSSYSGRADYIHYIADLLASSNNGVIPQGETINRYRHRYWCKLYLSNIIHTTYGWHLGTDIDESN